MRQLSKYGGPGFITSHVQGKTLECALIDGVHLILRFTDGHELKVGWQDSNGNQLKGTPFCESMDVKITLEGIQMGGVAGQL